MSFAGSTPSSVWNPSICGGCPKSTTIVEIDKWYPSSQFCHDCGFQNKAIKDLRIREWDCPQCGHHLDRDRNAARNILKEGLRQFEAEAAS